MLGFVPAVPKEVSFGEQPENHGGSLVELTGQSIVTNTSNLHSYCP